MPTRRTSDSPSPQLPLASGQDPGWDAEQVMPAEELTQRRAAARGNSGGGGEENGSPAGAAPPAKRAKPPPPAPLFASLDAWVSGYLAPIVTVELGQGMRWCPRWWRHAEAIARLESVWRAWEQLRIAEDPTAMSVWWRDHLDHHLGVLMQGERSPFRQCSPEKGHRDGLAGLPTEPAPDGWFGTEDTDTEDTDTDPA